MGFSSMGRLGYGFLEHEGIRAWVFEAWGIKVLVFEAWED